MNKLLYLLIIVLFIGCQDREQKDEVDKSDTEWIDPNEILQGPIIRDSLSSVQMESIEYLYNTFKEVDPTSYESWIDDFKRDENPDKEIEIWLMMAHAYNSFCEKNDIDLDKKKEVYKVVLFRSSVPEEEVLNNLDLMHLTEQEAKEIMKEYKLVSKPIRVIEK